MDLKADDSFSAPDPENSYKLFPNKTTSIFPPKIVFNSQIS